MLGEWKLPSSIRFLQLSLPTTALLMDFELLKVLSNWTVEVETYYSGSTQINNICSRPGVSM